MKTKESLLPESQKLKIVLIGRVGAGKTAVMKTILSGSRGNENVSSESTTQCHKEESKIGRHNVVIVDTPGLCHADKTDEEEEKVVNKIKEGVSLVAPGPHVFLLVMDLERFTLQEEDMVKRIWKTFGKGASKHTMVLFTHGNDLKKEGKTIEAFIKETKELQTFVSECNGGYHVIDNKNQDPSDADELLQKIKDLVDKNGGKSYRCYEPELRKRIHLAIFGSAVVGAVIGAAVGYFVSGIIGIPLGLAAGGVVFAVMGFIGIFAYERIKKQV